MQTYFLQLNWIILGTIKKDPNSIDLDDLIYLQIKLPSDYKQSDCQLFVEINKIY